MKKKADEENFDEAVQQSYRAWTETKVPSEISDLLQRSVTQYDDTLEIGAYPRLSLI